MRELNFGDRADLASVLSKENIEQLCVGGERSRWARHELLYRQGDKALFVHILITGSVKSCAVGAEGNETIFRLHLPGSVLGLTALSARQLRDASAIAVEPCETITLHRDQVKATLSANGALAVSVMEILLDRIWHFQFRMRETLGTPLEARLARALLELSREEETSRKHVAGSGSTITVTHEDLGHILGARRPTISKFLRRFAAQGLIETAHRSIRVVNRPGLRAAAGDSAVPLPAEV